MKLAQDLVEHFNLEHTLEILERQRPARGDTNDLRGYEWRYLWQLCQGSPHEFLPGAVGMPWSLVVSPTGEFVAAASDSSSRAGVIVWRLDTKHIVARLDYDSNSDGDSAGVAFSEDGRKILTACHRRVKFFETGTWRELPELTLTNASGPIDLRGDTLVTTAVGHMEDPTRLDGLTVWNLRTRTSETIPHVTGPPSLSPDGRQLALQSEAGIEIRRVDRLATRHLLLENSIGLLAHRSGFGSLRRGLAFSPDGRRIAAPGQADERGDIPVLIWNLGNGRRIDGNRLIGHAARIQALAWESDGRRIATASADGTIRVWDVDGRNKPVILTGHLSEPWCVTFAPKGDTIISSGIATWEDKVKVWRLDDPASKAEVTDEWYPLWLSRDGSEVFTGSETGVGTYRERVSGRILQKLEMPAGTPPLSTASTDLHIIGAEKAPAAFLGFTTGQMVSWGIGTNQFPRLLQAHQAPVRMIASLPDRRLLITGGDDRAIHWWNLDTAQLVRSNHLAHPVTALAASPDGKTLVSAACEQGSRERRGREFQLAEWDAASGKLLSTLALPGFTSNVGFSPDGKCLAVCARDEKGAVHTHIFDLGSRKWRARLEGEGRRLDFSPDGSHLLIWSRLWDLRSNPPQSKVLSGHRQRLMQQTFSPDSRTAVSTGDDGTTRLWSVATGQEMFSFVEPGRTFNDPVFSADGTTLAVGSFTQDGRPIRFWHAPTLEEIDTRIREGRINQ